jgi:hypothetical protein
MSPITCAAIRFNDDVWTGPFHAAAAMELADELGFTLEEILMSPFRRDSRFAFGFLTRDGDFVNRVEAARLLGRDGALDSYDL